MTVSGFMTDAWAADCAAAINAWPPPEVKASKLQDFWDWIDMVRPAVTGRLVLSVRDLPAGAGADGDSLVIDLDAGVVKEASVAERSDVEGSAVFVLAGGYGEWIAMLDGYDVGKTVMYRKLMLEKGESLQFFMAAFFWTELLAAIQSVDAARLQPA